MNIGTSNRVNTLTFAALVQQFFTEHLVTQRAVSPRTVACYRDALMLFLDFASHKLGKTPTSLQLIDIRPELILAFLDHLEQERHNGVRSRNLRLTALRAFLKFAGRRDVTSLHVVEQALGVPMKRFERPMLGYLTRMEMVAVLGQPGDSWSSQRDHRNRSLSGVLCPPAPTRNNPSHIHQGGAGSDQGDSDQQQVAAA